MVDAYDLLKRSFTDRLLLINKENPMKKLYLLSKILVFVLCALLIFTAVGMPLISTFTTNDRAPSINAFFGWFIEFLPLVLPCLVILVPALALKSYAAFKYGDINAAVYKKRITVYAISEIIVIASFAALMIIINSSNFSQLS